MSEPRAVVFDFDGVIVESVDIKNHAFGELFRETHPDKVEEILAFQLANVGASRLEKFPRIYDEILGIPFPEGELERLDGEFSRLVFNSVASCPFVRGAPELLARLCEGHELYVASATPAREVCDLVVARGLTRFFRNVYGAPETKKEILGRVLRERRLEPQELLFVGDAANDLSAARAVGVRFIGRVPRGAETPFAEERGVPGVEDLAQLDEQWTGLLGG